jgi:hypothetical protein
MTLKKRYVSYKKFKVKNDVRKKERKKESLNLNILLTTYITINDFIAFRTIFNENVYIFEAYFRFKKGDASSAKLRLL